MPDDAFLIEDVADRLADRHHVHVWQRLLREEAPCVDVSPSCEAVHRAHNFNLAIRLDQESDAGTGHLVAHAGRSSLNDASYSTKRGHVLGPALEQRWHRHNCFLGQILGEDGLDLLDKIKVWVKLLFLELLQRLDLVYIEMSEASTIEFIVNLEDPSRDVEILGNQLGQGVDELLLVVDVDTADWSGHVSELEDLLCS